MQPQPHKTSHGGSLEGNNIIPESRVILKQSNVSLSKITVCKLNRGKKLLTAINADGKIYLILQRGVRSCNSKT